MRYFFVSYNNKTLNGWGYGNMTFECQPFPSNKYMKQLIKKTFNISDVVIMNLFEFKSVQDYVGFTRA